MIVRLANDWDFVTDLIQSAIQLSYEDDALELRKLLTTTIRFCQKKAEKKEASEKKCFKSINMIKAKCRTCGKNIPTQNRVDSLYCSEKCRKTFYDTNKRKLWQNGAKKRLVAVVSGRGL